MIFCKALDNRVYPAAPYTLALGFCLLVLSPLHAAENEPIKVEKNWVSATEYDASAAGAVKNNDQAATGPVISTPALDAGATKPDATSPAATSSVAGAVVATPTRPLEMPVMPGVTRGSYAPIDSADNAAAPRSAITSALPENNWHKPLEKSQENLAGTGDESIPVRLSFLPSRHITPVPSSMQAASHDRAAMIQNEMANPTTALPATMPAKPQTPAQMAACAAVDSYKQKQLKAIQSDRQTLAALQAAIAQLGLQNQLGFLTDPAGGAGKQTTTVSASSDATHTENAAQRRN